MAVPTKRGLKDGFRSDGIAGLVLIALAVVLHLSTDLLSVLDNRLFDRASQSTGRQPSEQVVILAIDDESIANIGRWPWSRDVHAKVIDDLTNANVKAIAHTVFFTEPQIDRGLPHLQHVAGLMSQVESSEAPVPELKVYLERAIRELDADTLLTDSVQRNGRVVLPLVFQLGLPLGNVDAALPGFVLKTALPGDPSVPFRTSTQVQLPLPTLGEAALGVGHLNQLVDRVDGVVRADPLMVQHGSHWIPSLALVAAAKGLNLSTTDLRLAASDRVQLGGVEIPFTQDGLAHPQIYPSPGEGRHPFAKDSFYDLYSGKIPASKYAGKIVVIGSTAAGVGATFSTPGYEVVHPAEILAHFISSVLKGHFFSVPEWAPTAGLLAFLVVSAYVIFVLPALSAAWAALTTAVLLCLLLLSHYVLVAQFHAWIPLMLSIAALSIGYLGLTTKRYLFTEAGKLRTDQESAETNRMMGLALQGQGQLDMAFDRFRRVPLSDAVMDNLANLALDFERKRLFNKAQAVYEHMASHNRNYKDLQAKLKRAKNLSETVMLGGTSVHRGGSLMLDGDDTVAKPMLGRYQVEKKLGKGAMGVVYLGRDPKIGRTVAIKTMALAQEFEGSELEDARQRFFREAETAGRLQHQHIVTIFDAGEDHDLAYIAMEFLRGKDLVGHTQPNQLLPIQTVVSIGARVAEALHYAHGLNVVHRDIKPANIMYEPESDTVKVTDFGIARVTDASRTRTGMVLGTPSFMSPEQIAGKKVDGRSDLYSLGVMLYQLLSGALPFKAESMAELMFKVANEPAPDLRRTAPSVSAELARVVAKAMAKRFDERYATGQDMAHDLRQCLAPALHDAGRSLGQAAASPVNDFAETVLMPHEPDAHAAPARPGASSVTKGGVD